MEWLISRLEGLLRGAIGIKAYGGPKALKKSIQEKFKSTTKNYKML